MKDLISPASLVLSGVMGMVSGYVAYRQKKNPYIWFFIGFCLGFIGLYFLMLQKKQKPKRGVVRKAKRTLVLQGPSDKLWFYLDGSRQQVGPISYNAIAKAFTQGTISQSTFVWNEELTEWKKLEELTVLKNEKIPI